MNRKLSRYSLATLIGLGLGASAFAHAAQQTETTAETDSVAKHKKQPAEETIVVTAAKQNLQAPGVSTISADEIKKRPPARDISELIRTMPGVNLTGNSTSGQRGNNRQIDIRGMGPENTLILIDGKPATSRNSVRQGWRGERDTRGDTAWVPPEMIERIEVLRGPAAARYGNGAAGGVVNIITKKNTKELHGSLNAYFNVPQHKQEGSTKRTDFSLSGPLTDELSFRLFGGYSKTQADAWDINESHKSARVGTYANSTPSGREGVEDKNIDAMLHWDFAHLQSLEFEYAYGRQGNLYAGDTQNTNSNPLVQSNYGKETNRIYRETFGLNHRGAWDNGVSTNNYIQFERTRNTRLNEGLAGGTEGIFDTKNEGFGTTKLDDFLAHSEVSVPFELGVTQTATVGTEWNQQKMKDGSSIAQSLAEGGALPGVGSGSRSPYSSAHIFSLFAEDNIELTDSTMLTPGLRYDLHSEAGNNWSPALNLSQELGDFFTLKMGIARAYKAPNLFQTNGDYVLFSRGQGCADSSTACYLVGNDDLKAETSVNKEIGLEFHNEGWLAGVTYFRNDYHNKIESGYTPVGTTAGKKGTTNIYQWENVPKAVVQGLEGTLNVPVSETVSWSNNATYMIENKNKTTGDYLSIIPEFTINSTLSWQATQELSMQSTLTWYGRQKPKKYNYQGKQVSGTETKEVSPYAVVGASATYDVTKNISLTAGIDNLFDKRQFREGNSQNVGDPTTGAINIAGAGAATYNEPGRTYYMSVNTHF
ncbi:iron-enterobactin outer membrane transporter [Serratia proteamaculans]|uniref:TonB-dependent siderophore receptor n=1 Tax=Serratia proteamaculans TaxID=28151 RepID=UPI0009F7B30D|nr:TonB-dependent siderophore receptor [Serratia proteamaculans]SMB43352.1 iron-enterobactin outer membrane transporter [Serratia proteamaculans]